ncbi:hypothetical protein WA588_000689, partial [Blastocystis sp. NMH]
MNEYLPQHMYFSNITPPFSMSQVPASLLLNRLVMKRKIKFSRADDRNQRRVAFYRSESALSCVWMPLNDYIVTAWNNGKIVKMNGVNYQFNLQQDISNCALNCVKMSHNGKFLITADDQGNVFRLTPSLTSAPTTKLETESILDLAISANDNYVITGGKSKILRVWAINENDMEYNFDLGEQNQTITSVASSNVSSLLLTGCEDANVHLWDLRKKQSVRRITGHTEKVNRVQFCPTNENLILSAAKDKSIRIIDIRTYDTLSVLKGHNAEIITASFHPTESSLLVSGDYGGNINFWSIHHDSPLYTVNHAHARSIRDICFQPEGIGMVTMGDDATIRFWQRNRPGDREELDGNALATMRIPLGSSYDFSAKKGFDLPLEIPEIGAMSETDVMGVNLPLPSSSEREPSLEERQDELKEFREDDNTIPPRNYVCTHCGRNGHWAHKCKNAIQTKGGIEYLCRVCQKNHLRDDCPYRGPVRSDYVCNCCKGKGHQYEDCPKRIRNRRKVVTEHMKYSQLIRLQEGENLKQYV